MRVHDLITNLGLEVFTSSADTSAPVEGAYVSDLLSDVMGNAAEGQAWITLQAHTNVVAIASLKDLPVVILVNGIKPGSELLEKAEDAGVCLAGSKDSTFVTAGKLYKLFE